MKLTARKTVFAAAAIVSGALFADKLVVDGIEWTYFTDTYAEIGNGDKATVTGVVGGKKLASISWVLLASSKSGDVYTVYVDIIAPGLKRDCTLVLTATIDGNGVLQQLIKTVQ